MTTVSPVLWSVNAYITLDRTSTSTASPSGSFANFSELNVNISEDPFFDEDDDCRFRPTVENYITIVSFCIIFCLSVVGNAIVVVVILQQRTMRSITNLYLLNLAISDLMLSIVCMPPTLVSSVIYCWMFGNMLCKLFAYLQPVVVTASAYTLAVIAFERYYAICRPLHSRIWQTRSHAYAMISLVWIISILANFFMLFMFELQSYHINGLNCAPRFSPTIHFGYQIYMTSVLLLVPLCLMTILYGSVIRSLKNGMKMDIAAVGGPLIEHEVSMDDADNERPRKPRLVNRISRAFRLGDSQSCLLYQKSPFHVQKTTNIGVRRAPTVSRQNTVPYEKAREAESSTENNYAPLLKAHKLRSTHSEKAILAKQRVIRMLIVIVIIFFCCWTPNYIWWLILTAQDSFQLFDVWNSQVNTAITVLCYIPSCANPITYCFLNKKFRTALLLSFGCIRSPLRNRFHTVYLPKIDQTNITSKEYPSNGRQHLQRTHNCRHTVNETNGINTANDLRSSLYRSIPVLYQQRSFDVNANKAVDTPNVEKRRADSMKIRRDCCDSFSKMDYFNEEEERGLKKILNETNI